MDPAPPDLLHVAVHLHRIYCYMEGDGWGSAEPYLWSIFFKIDDTTVQQDPNNPFLLVGGAEFHFGPGSHGNLSSHDVDPGDAVTAGAAGGWHTKLGRITVVNPFKKDAPPVRAPGIIGAVFVLMEENAISDSDAEAGHKALNAYVQKRINDFVLGLNLLELSIEASKLASDQQLTMSEALEQVLKARVDDLKDEIAKGAKAEVKKAIKGELNIFQKIAAFVDPDEMVGNHAVTYSLDEILSWPDKPVFGKSGMTYVLSRKAGFNKQLVNADLGMSYELFWSVEGKQHFWSVPDNVIPPDQELGISTIRKRYSKAWKSDYITHVGGMTSGDEPWLLPRSWVAGLIEKGQKAFYVQREDGGKTPVKVYKHEKTGGQYIATVPDETTADNLLSLSDHGFAWYVEVTDEIPV
jgi:Protein of unknown function (DUF3892)